MSIWKDFKAETIEEMEELYSSIKEGLRDKSYYRKAKALLKIVTIILLIALLVWLVAGIAG